MITFHSVTGLEYRRNGNRRPFPGYKPLTGIVKRTYDRAVVSLLIVGLVARTYASGTRQSKPWLL